MMVKFLSISLRVMIILSVLIDCVVLFREFTSLTRQRRPPLEIEITETDNPFTVSDRHDDTRSWIDDRLNQE